MIGVEIIQFVKPLPEKIETRSHSSVWYSYAQQHHSFKIPAVFLHWYPL